MPRSTDPSTDATGRQPSGEHAGTANSATTSTAATPVRPRCSGVGDRPARPLAGQPQDVVRRTGIMQVSREEDRERRRRIPQQQSAGYGRPSTEAVDRVAALTCAETVAKSSGLPSSEPSWPRFPLPHGHNRVTSRDAEGAGMVAGAFSNAPRHGKCGPPALPSRKIVSMSSSAERMRRLRERRAAGLDEDPAADLRPADELVGPALEETITALQLTDADAGAVAILRATPACSTGPATRLGRPVGLVRCTWPGSIPSALRPQHGPG